MVMRISFNEAVLLDDYPDTAATTGSISIGGSISGIIDDINDKDWFRVSLEAGQRYEFLLINGKTLTIFDADGASLGGGFSEFLTYTATNTGAHYLEVSLVSARLVSALPLIGEEYTASAVLDDYAATTDTTGFITIASNTNGNIESEADRDWFQVSLEAGQHYEFRVNSETINPIITLPRIKSGKGDIEHNLITFTAKKTGIHYLEVKNSISNETGDYTVSASEVSSPADRIFNWAESVFTDLFPNHEESTEVLGYYARIYDNGSAVGELNNDLYFYNGDSITLVGVVEDYLSNAIDAGF